MDVHLALRILAIAVLALAVALGLRAARRWYTRRASGIVAGGLAVLAIAAFVVSTLDVFAPRAPVPGPLSLYYVRDNNAGESLEAASAATGAVRWRYTPSSGLGPASPPTLANGVLYLGISDARLGSTIHALRASDGQQLWATPVAGFDVQGTPAVDHDVVYAAASGGIYALRAMDGRQLWHLPWTVTHISDVQVAYGVVYAALIASGAATSPQQATIYALRASDGAIIWTHPVPGEGYGTLTVADGVIYLRSLQGGLVALDAPAGRPLWQRHDLGGSSSPVAANGMVYLLSDPDGALLALDTRNGGEVWRTRLDNASQFVSIAGQTLYVGGGSVYAVRTSDGHIVWRSGAGGQFYQPVAADGVVFVGSSNFPNTLSIHPFGFGSNDFLNALDAKTGALYWRSSGAVEGVPVVST